MAGGDGDVAEQASSYTFPEPSLCLGNTYRDLKAFGFGNQSASPEHAAPGKERKKDLRGFFTLERQRGEARSSVQARLHHGLDQHA